MSFHDEPINFVGPIPITDSFFLKKTIDNQLIDYQHLFVIGICISSSLISLKIYNI